MSRVRGRRFPALDDRAHETVQRLLWAIGGMVGVEFLWRILAPTLNVTILGPIQLFRRLLASSVTTGVRMDMGMGLSSPAPFTHLFTVKVLFSYGFWMIGLVVSLWLVATLASAFWYALGWWEQASSSTAIGGEFVIEHNNDDSNNDDSNNDDASESGCEHDEPARPGGDT